MKWACAMISLWWVVPRWCLVTAATFFNPSLVCCERAYEFSERPLQSRVRYRRVCAIFGKALTWSVETDFDRISCSGIAPALANRDLHVEDGLFSLGGMIECLYLGLLLICILVISDQNFSCRSRVFQLTFDAEKLLDLGPIHSFFGPICFSVFGFSVFEKSDFQFNDEQFSEFDFLTSTIPRIHRIFFRPI